MNELMELISRVIHQDYCPWLAYTGTNAVQHQSTDSQIPVYYCRILLNIEMLPSLAIKLTSMMKKFKFAGLQIFTQATLNPEKFLKSIYSNSRPAACSWSGIPSTIKSCQNTAAVWYIKVRFQEFMNARAHPHTFLSPLKNQPGCLCGCTVCMCVSLLS